MLLPAALTPLGLDAPLLPQMCFPSLQWWEVPLVPRASAIPLRFAPLWCQNCLITSRYLFPTGLGPAWAFQGGRFSYVHYPSSPQFTWHTVKVAEAFTESILQGTLLSFAFRYFLRAVQQVQDAYVVSLLDHTSLTFADPSPLQEARLRNAPLTWTPLPETLYVHMDLLIPGTNKSRGQWGGMLRDMEPPPGECFLLYGPHGRPLVLRDRRTGFTPPWPLPWQTDMEYTEV